MTIRVTRIQTSPAATGSGSSAVARGHARGGDRRASLANYLRILGFEARSHTATTTDVNLHRLAVSAGLGCSRRTRHHKPVHWRPLRGRGGDDLDETRAGSPVAPTDAWRSLAREGSRWWLGAASPKTPRTVVDMAGRRTRTVAIPPRNSSGSTRRPPSSTRSAFRGSRNPARCSCALHSAISVSQRSRHRRTAIPLARLR